MAKLRTHVHVHRKNKAGEVDTVVLGPGEDVPDWAEQLITNRDAWAEPPANQTGSGQHRGQDSSGSR